MTHNETLARIIIPKKYEKYQAFKPCQPSKTGFENKHFCAVLSASSVSVLGSLKTISAYNS